MISNTSHVWNNQAARQLAKVLTEISDTGLMQNFLRDVMTEKEIREVSSRLEAAKMLYDNCTYDDIERATGLSSRTIARISEWIKDGAQGYKVILEVIKKHQ